MLVAVSLAVKCSRRNVGGSEQTRCEGRPEIAPANAMYPHQTFNHGSQGGAPQQARRHTSAERTPSGSTCQAEGRRNVQPRRWREFYRREREMLIDSDSTCTRDGERRREPRVVVCSRIERRRPGHAALTQPHPPRTRTISMVHTDTNM
jgi:hypothetical protein